MTLWHFYLILFALYNIAFKFSKYTGKNPFLHKKLEFPENVGVYFGFSLKNTATIEVLTRKFQGLSMIQDTAKVKNANFEGAKIGGLVYTAK